MPYFQQILRDEFGASLAYIAKFNDIVMNAGITLDNLFLGQVDAKEPYTAEEQAEIIWALSYLVNQQFKDVAAVEDPKYVASGGAPGSGKTFALERMHGIDVAARKFLTAAVYVGPDSVVLPQMPAYIKTCREVSPGAAYTKWSDASNFIANFMLVKAMADGLNIVHDTTSTSPKVKTITAQLKALGYRCELHFFIADKEARENAIMFRKGMVTREDAVSKAEAAYQRLADHDYEACYDQITFYAQRGEYWLGKGSTMIFAVYDRESGPSITVLEDGQQHIHRIMAQMVAKENLDPTLVAKVQSAVAEWKHIPDAQARERVGAMYRLV